MAAVWGYAEPLRILCAREFQVSIAESFHAELKAAIEAHDWLADAYDVGKDYLRGRNGTEFIFCGLRRNMSSIKSTANIDLCVIEEAEDVPEHAWIDLEPSIRAPKSEIWAIWNPRVDRSPVDQRFIKTQDDAALMAQMHYWDNPWFPEVLEQQRKRDRERMDASAYAHVWEGGYLENSEAQVLHGKVRVSEFEPGARWDGPYHGLDYGFANDPTAAVRCWVHDDSLWIEQECGGVGIELDDTPALITGAMPDAYKHVIRADNARPESTSYLKRHGLPRVESAAKWPGSIDDGIAHLRSYKEIVIHPRCTETIRETRLYSYKVDRQTGDILPKPVDLNNNYLDSLRYALSPLIRGHTYTLKNI
jgi:phage terminase large subunit